MRSTGAFDQGRVAEPDPETLQLTGNTPMKITVCLVPDAWKGGVDLVVYPARLTTAPAGPKSPFALLRSGGNQTGPGVRPDSVATEARCAAGPEPWSGLVQRRRQGSRWPPDQCDSVVFGVSS